MKIINVEQGSNEWLQSRCGKITGTRLADVFKTDNLSLIDELIAEMVTENYTETVTSKAMQNGKDTEPLVRYIYQEVKGINIQEIGFCISEWNEYLALSPDGFTLDFKGGIEVKCPTAKVHVKYIRQNKLPNEYKYQVYNYFLVNEELEWLDFISYNESFKIRPMFIKRIKRNDIINELEETKKEIVKFTEKLNKYYNQIIK